MQPQPQRPPSPLADVAARAEEVRALLREALGLARFGALGLAGATWSLAGSQLAALRQSARARLRSPIALTESLSAAHENVGASLFASCVTELNSQLVLQPLVLPQPLFQLQPPPTPRSLFAEPHGGRPSDWRPPSLALAYSLPSSPSTLQSPASPSASLRISDALPQSLRVSVQSGERLRDIVECGHRLGALPHLVVQVLAPRLRESVIAPILDGRALLRSGLGGGGGGGGAVAAPSLELVFGSGLRPGFGLGDAVPQQAQFLQRAVEQIALLAALLRSQLAEPRAAAASTASIENAPSFDKASVIAQASPLRASAAAGGGARAARRLASPSPASSPSPLHSPSRHRPSAAARTPPADAPSMVQVHAPLPPLSAASAETYALLGCALWLGGADTDVNVGASADVGVAAVSIAGAGVGRFLAERCAALMPLPLAELDTWAETVLAPLARAEAELARLGFVEPAMVVGGPSSSLPTPPPTPGTQLRQVEQQQLLQQLQERALLPLAALAADADLRFAQRARAAVLTAAHSACDGPLPEARGGTVIVGTDSGFSGASVGVGVDSLCAAAAARLPRMRVTASATALGRLVRDALEQAATAAAMGRGGGTRHAALAGAFLGAARDVVVSFLTDLPALLRGGVLSGEPGPDVIDTEGEDGVDDVDGGDAKAEYGNADEAAADPDREPASGVDSGLLLRRRLLRCWPRRAMLLHNDARYISHVLARAAPSARVAEAAVEVGAHDLVLELLPPLEALAQGLFQGEVARQRHLLLLAPPPQPQQPSLQPQESLPSPALPKPHAAPGAAPPMPEAEASLLARRQQVRLLRLGRAWADVLPRPLYCRAVGHLADACLERACVDAAAAIVISEPAAGLPASPGPGPGLGLRGERSNALAAARLALSLQCVLSACSTLLAGDAGAGPAQIVPSWGRGKALEQALRWPLDKVRERSCAGHFLSKGREDSGVSTADLALILAWRFAPSLGRKGVLAEMGLLQRMQSSS